jgi:hypothetical protein
VPFFLLFILGCLLVDHLWPREAKHSEKGEPRQGMSLYIVKVRQYFAQKTVMHGQNTKHTASVFTTGSINDQFGNASGRSKREFYKQKDGA